MESPLKITSYHYTSQELTKRKEKLLVDMAPMGQEEASVPLHLDDTDQSRLGDQVSSEFPRSFMEKLVYELTLIYIDHAISD